MRLNIESGKRKENDDYCYENNTNSNANSSNKFLGVSWYFNHRKNHRYYVLMIQKDLFETIIVTKIWGSKDRKGSRVVHMPFNTKSEALVYVDKVTKVRKRRGYELVADGK